MERSNPTAIAINEAKKLWETIAHLSIINIGAGKQYNAVLFTPADLANATLEKIAHHPDDIATRIQSLASDYTFTNFLGQISLQMSMKCEEVYQQIPLTSQPESAKEPRIDPCVRFNIDKGVDLNRGYEEWAEVDSLESATEIYMQDQISAMAEMRLLPFNTFVRLVREMASEARTVDYDHRWERDARVCLQLFTEHILIMIFEMTYSSLWSC